MAFVMNLWNNYDPDYVMCVSVLETCIVMPCVDAYLCYDISVLFTCLHHIRDAMEGEATYYFEQDLYYTTDPLELAARNVSLILSDPRSLFCHFSLRSVLNFISTSSLFFFQFFDTVG